LDGVTRDSILTLASDLGYRTEERAVSIEEVIIALENKTMNEAFGAGTAAVVAPIQIISINEADYDLPAWGDKSFMVQVKRTLTNMRTGKEPDIHEWNYVIS